MSTSNVHISKEDQAKKHVKGLYYIIVYATGKQEYATPNWFWYL